MTMKNQNNREHLGDGSGRNDRQITIAAARKMLGMLARNYTDADMAEIIDVLYGIAEEGFDLHQDIGCPSDQDE